MTEYARLVVAVDSTQAAKARAELDKLPGSARKASSAADGLTSSFKKLGGVLATYFSVREVVRAAEAYTTINNRLRLVTASSEQFAQAQADLFRIAQNSRQPLTETAELYQRIATNQKELGLTGAGVARITEVINKSLAVSGTSAESAAGALTQLGQAFASGQLRGEELNSVLENAPALAQALARGMGVTVGQLRALGAEGKISAQAVVDALLSQGEALDQQFATLAPTVSGAMTTVGNAFVQLVGQMDQTTGASANAAAEIMKLADILSDPATVKAAQDLAAGIATALGWVVEAATSTVGAVQWMAEELAVLFNGIGLHDIDRLEQEASRLQELLNKMEQRGETGYAIYGSTKESYDKVKRQLDQAYELADLASTLQSGSGSPVPAAAAQRPALRMASSGTGVVEKEISNSKALQAQLKAELAAKRELTAQEQIRIDILRESGQLRAANDAQFQLEYAEKIAEYERQGNVEALQRLETLRRIREVQMNADQAPGTVEGVTKAPNSGVVSPEIGGAASEFMRLQEQATQLEEWRATELEKQRGFLEAKAINEEQYAERIRNIQEQSQHQQAELESARQLVMLTSTEDLFGSLAGMAQSFAGEQSSLYKAMFAVEKAAAIARSIVAIQGAIASASWSLPFPANLGAMATVAASTAGIVSTIASTSLSFDGGGYTGNGPRSGGLDGKGGFLAMMHPQETVIDHTKSSGKSGSGGGAGVVVNLIEDASKAGQVEQSSNDNGEQVLRVWVARIRAGGTAESQAIEQAFGLQRAGR